MLTMVAGLLLFMAAHLVPTSPSLRAELVGRFGRGAYMAAFSVVSAAALILIAVGYGKLQLMPGKNPIIWDPPIWGRHLALLLMLPAMILLAAAYIPSRIRTAIRHPMLAAIKVWALAHLLANGDLGSLVLFGAFLAYAVFDRISVKRREAGGLEARGPLGGRNGGLVGDISTVAVGLAAYWLVVVYVHPVWIGVPVWPG